MAQAAQAREDKLASVFATAEKSAEEVMAQTQEVPEPSAVMSFVMSAVKKIREADAETEMTQKDWERQTEKLLQQKDDMVAATLGDLAGRINQALVKEAQQQALTIGMISTEFEEKLRINSLSIDALNQELMNKTEEMNAKEKKAADREAKLREQLKQNEADWGERLKKLEADAEKRLKQSEERAKKRLDECHIKSEAAIAKLEGRLEAEVSKRQACEAEILKLRQDKKDLAKEMQQRLEEQAQKAQLALNKRVEIDQVHFEDLKQSMERKLLASESERLRLDELLKKKEADFKAALEEELAAEDRTLLELAELKKRSNLMLAQRDEQIAELHVIVEAKVLEIRELHIAHKAAMEKAQLLNDEKLAELLLLHTAEVAALKDEMANVIVQFEAKVEAQVLLLAAREAELLGAFEEAKKLAALELAQERELNRQRMAQKNQQLQATQEALEKEKERFAAEVMRLGQEAAAALAANQRAANEKLEQVVAMYTEKLEKLAVEKDIAVKEVQLLLVAAEEALMLLKAEMAEKLAKTEKHYKEAIQALQEENEKHMDSMVAQVESLHTSLDRQKEQYRSQLQALKANLEAVEKQKNEQLQRLEKASHKKLEELRIKLEGKVLNAVQDGDRRVAMQKKQLQKVRQESIQAQELLRAEMQAMRVTFDARLVDQIAKDQEIMAIMREEFKLKRAELEEVISVVKLEATALVELKERELFEYKVFALEEATKAKAKFEAALAEELVVDEVLQAENIKLKEKIAMEQAQHEKSVAALRAELKEKLGIKDRELVELAALLEMKVREEKDLAAAALQALRDEHVKAIAEKVAAEAALIAEHRRIMQAKEMEMAAAVADWMRRLAQAEEEWKAKVLAAEALIVERVHATEVLMAEAIAVLEQKLLDEAAKHEQEQREWGQLVESKEKSWAQEVMVIETQLASEIKLRDKTIEALRIDLAALGTAKEKQVAELQEKMALALRVKDEELAALAIAMQLKLDELSKLYFELQADSAEQLRLQRAQASDERAQREKEFSAKLRAKELELEELGKSCQQLLAQKQKDMEAAIATIREDCKAKVLALSDKLEHTRADLQHEREHMKQMKIDDQAAADRRCAALEERMNAALRAAKEAHEQQLASVISAYDAKLAKAEEAYKQELRIADRLKQEKVADAQMLEAKYRKWVEDERNVEAALKEENKLLKDAAAKLERDLERQVQLVILAKEQSSQALKDAIADERKLNEERLAVALAEWKKLEADILLQMEVAVAAKVAELEQMEARYILKVEALTKLHDQAVAEHEAAIIALEDTLRRRAEAERNDVMSQLSTCQIQLEQLKKERNEKVKELEQLLFTRVHDMELLLAAREQELKDAMSKERSEANARIQEKQDELDKLRKATAERIAEREQALKDLAAIMEQQLKDKDRLLQDQAAAAVVAVEVIELKLKAANEKAEKDMIARVAEFEARILMITSKHEDILKRKEKEAEENVKRLQAKLAMKEKEADLYAKQVEAKARELKDTVAQIQHDDEIKEKQLTAALQDEAAKFKAMKERKEQELTELDARRRRELEQAAADAAKAQKAALDSLQEEYERKLFKANEKAMEAQEIAVAAIVVEREALLVEKAKMAEKIQELELNMAGVCSKELAAEEFISKQNEKLKKDLARAQADSDDRAAKLREEIEYANAQKKRAVEEEDKACEKRIRMKDAELSALTKESNTKQAEAKRAYSELQRSTNQQLKSKEDEVMIATREIERLRKALDQAEVEVDIEVDIEEVVIVEEKVVVTK